MRGSIHNSKDSHPQCTECGKKFASMGKAINHWSMPCETNDDEE